MVLAELPEDLDIPVVVVQHMPQFFLRRFAERLHAQGPLPTALATNDGPLLPGRVWVAPGDKHLEIRGGPGAYRAILRGGRRLHGCRPAVDVTLVSLARAGAGPAQVVILTGMGRDGADGAKALLPHGAHVIAQDKATSVVWGMPGAVSNEGTAHAVLPISQIAPALRARLPSV
jgi:two-component system, chemotaxis family, protein-glutamate methylesterase/glutaminase